MSKKSGNIIDLDEKLRDVAEDIKHGVPTKVIEKRHGVTFVQLITGSIIAPKKGPAAPNGYKTSSKNVDNYIERFNIKKDGNKKGTH